MMLVKTVRAPARFLRISAKALSRLSRMLGGQGGGRAPSHDEIDLERDQFGKPLDLAVGRSVFDHDVPALDVSEVTQALAEGSVERRVRSGEREIANAVHLPCRLG